MKARLARDCLCARLREIVGCQSEVNNALYRMQTMTPFMRGQLAPDVPARDD